MKRALEVEPPCCDPVSTQGRCVLDISAFKLRYMQAAGGVEPSLLRSVLVYNTWRSCMDRGVPLNGTSHRVTLPAHRATSLQLQPELTGFTQLLDMQHHAPPHSGRATLSRRDIRESPLRLDYSGHTRSDRSPDSISVDDLFSDINWAELDFASSIPTSVVHEWTNGQQPHSRTASINSMGISAACEDLDHIMEVLAAS